MRIVAIAAAGFFAGGLLSVQAGFTADFEDLSLPPDSRYNGGDSAGGFTSQGAEFGNFFDNSQGFDYWSGFAASTINDPSTPGYGNQYASAAGTGVHGSLTYGVGYDDQFGPDYDTVSFASPSKVLGMYVNNTTFAALSMLTGDVFAKKFGGGDGTDPDWFLLTINGQDTGGAVTGSMDVYLADYRSADGNLDYILTEWTWVDLTGLGDQVSQLDFTLTSSDTGTSGMNTPAYFAVDDLMVIPEPSVLGLLMVGIGIGWLRHRRTC